MAVPCALAAAALRASLGEDKSKLFAPLAIAFYSGAFWLPVAALVTLAPGPRRPRVVAALAVVSLALGVWSTAIEPNRLEVREETVDVPGWSRGRPLRIVHVSDLQTVGPCRRDRRAAEMVNAAKPDLVIVTGDYIAGPYTDPWPAIASARRFLAALRAPLGVVLTRGHCVPRRFFDDLLDGLDVIMLVNDTYSVELGDGRRVRIVGLGVHDVDLDLVTPPAGEDELLIVASHVPDLTRDLTGRGVHLHLAGHTHGGQVVIPGYGALMTLSDLPRRYARGLHRWEDHWLNVTAGIGMEGHHAPRVRLFCPPEICVLEVRGGR